MEVAPKCREVTVSAYDAVASPVASTDALFRSDEESDDEESDTLFLRSKELDSLFPTFPTSFMDRYMELP